MMKELFALTVMFIPASLCVGFAGYLAMINVDGWGWFLFATMFVIPNSIEFNNDKKKAKINDCANTAT